MKTILSTLFFLFLSPVASAHVKWFSQYDFQNTPLTLSQIMTPVFFGLFILSLVSLPLLVWTDKLGEKSSIYQKVNNFLDRYSDDAPLIMRVAMGAVLLMSWQGDSIVAPELPIPSPGWGWFQFLLALLLLFRETTFLTGLGMILLYMVGLNEHGLFHMLDYVVYPSVGLYLILCYEKSERFRNLDLPILYSGLGFSLCWVAFEKMIYPYWGLSVLGQAPALTMGLEHQFFLLSCAFIEFTLGYLLIICLLHRPLAIIVTLTFFTTTCFFGKMEIVGHTILHGALLVFIVKGPGHRYQAPIRFHSSLWMRSLFAIVNFVILFFALAWPYQKMSASAYEEAKFKALATAHPAYELPAGVPAPFIMIHPVEDVHGGWNLHLMTENFKFTPENAGKESIDGEGHAHLYVNGEKVSRIYGNWFHIKLGKGKNKLKVTLNTNSHEDYFVGGKQVSAEVEVEEGRSGTVIHHH